MSIFISFSGSAREDVAIKFLNFFNKYGLHCWYDQHELLLGDNLKNTIIEKGINKANYGIIIINDTFLSRDWPKYEAILLYNRLKKETIFPILLDISKEDVLKSDISFILNIKYQFLKTGENINLIGFQILNRIFHDILKMHKITNMNQAEKYYKRLSHSNDLDIYNALTTYGNFDETNYRDKTIFLICLLRLFNNSTFEKTVREISYHVFNNDEISLDMLKIIECIFLILVPANN